MSLKLAPNLPMNLSARGGRSSRKGVFLITAGSRSQLMWAPR